MTSFRLAEPAMEAIEWVVLAVAGAAIGWVNWYFFLADRRSQ